MRALRSAAAILSIAAIGYACGGGGGILGPEGSLNLAASSRILQTAPTRFEVSLAISNPTSAPITVSAGCLGILVFANAARTGQPIYDSRTLQLCAESQQTFQPNQTRTFTGTATTSNVLGTSGPVGTYYLSAAMLVGTTNAVLAAGQVELRR